MEKKEMKRDLVFRFFDGNATLEEERLLQEFVEASEANHDFFMKSRLEYDVMLMTSVAADVSSPRVIRFSGWMWKAAAVVGFLFTFSMIYFWKTTTNSNKYTTLSVPAGQRISLVLEDSTKVWLNANSTLKYPNEFSNSKRTVYLDGEGYFEVAKNERKPFVVKTQKGDVLVTGTKFNVEAYPADSVFETSLFEGGVDLYINDNIQATLKPNQKSQIINNKVVVLPINEMDSYLWRKGLIGFSNKKLEDILPEFAHNFNVKIEVLTKELPKEVYTGKFRQSEGIEYALQVLQRSIRFSYERNYETGIIYINK